MNFFDGYNYRVNKILLSTIGQWPYQSPGTNYTIVIVIATIACSQFLTKLCGLFSYIHDMDVVMECLMPIMVDVSGIIKIINSVVHVSEIRALLDQIRDDFHSMRYSNDMEILRKYADNGRKFTTIYVSVMYIVVAIFMLMPFQPLILRVANATTRPMLHIVEYYIDMNKYYFPILIHGYFSVAIFVTSIVAVDSIFIVFVQHACGLFILIGLRIERAIQKEHSAGAANISVVQDMAYRNMMQCVQDHKRALRFVVACILIGYDQRTALRFTNLMEIVYSKHFLFHSGLNMVAMSITGFGVLTKINDTPEFLRLVAVSWSLLFHLCFECLNAQKLMDHSGYLHTNLMNLNWYDASPRTRKLVIFMMMKTQAPCVLTAGGMFILCMETFATIVKTSVSYFTFLRSTQQTSFSET